MKKLNTNFKKNYKKIFQAALFIVSLAMIVSSTKTNAQTFAIKGTVSSSNSPVRYASLTFIDNADTSQKYSVLTDSLGNYRVSVIVTSVNTAKNNLPTKFKLEQNYPNPFSTSTDIPYKLKNQSDVHVTIYDILGREVRKFSVGNQAGGSHNLIWNGRNNFGIKVATGIYFYRLQANGQSQVKKMVFGSGHGNFSPTIAGNFSYQIPEKLKTEIQSGNYTVKIENSDNILPAIIPQQFSDIMIQNDTTLNFSVSSQTIASIYLDNTQQIIRGFGGANIVGWNPGLNYGDMTKAELQTCFGNGPGQLGFSILRLRIPPDSTQFNINVPSAKYAESLGAKVIASPWTPPASMKTNNSTVGGSLDTAKYAAYAGHLKSFADYMANNSAPLYAISLQNEPDANVNYESCYWSPTDFLNFCKNNAETIDARVMMPESESFNHSFSDPTLRDSIAASHVSIIAGHLYGSSPSPYQLAKEKGKEVWMTEYLDTDTSWSHVLGTGKQISDCMNSGYNAYVWWWMVRFYSQINKNGQVTKRGYVMSQFSKFVRPGYYKVENSAPQRGVYLTAYKDSSSSKVVIVALNTGSSKIYQTFSIDNGTVTSFTSYTTSETENVEQGNNIDVSGGKFTAVLEPSSITTFVSK